MSRAMAYGLGCLTIALGFAVAWGITTTTGAPDGLLIAATMFAGSGVWLTDHALRTAAGL